MHSDRSMERPSKGGGGSSSVTPSTASLNRRLGTSPAPRTLTPSEVELLQRSKKEMARVVHDVLTGERGINADSDRR